ncbi:unnamed protein product [Adineta ricciae]|uniref:MARVEL domain-containing protein n=1 Tax=Adineta ricciae TaxID=249248 RepID=A0A816DBN3_ADIRI|nr:unnamed protein product [Adineta ricciae]
MNAQNTSSNHTATEYSQSTYGAPSSSRESESRIDKAYLTSIRAILKFACLLVCLIAFICLVATTQCNGTHVFLATVAWLVIIMQMMIIIIFILRLQVKFPGIDFEFLDFFATSHDALYLLISSSITINYCRVPGQVAGGVMGLIAFLLLTGDAITIFLARRQETVANTNSSTGR